VPEPAVASNSHIPSVELVPLEPMTSYMPCGFAEDLERARRSGNTGDSGDSHGCAD
jgi:hypothetical protein